jgi:tripartite-type tricarboxylate transporter receptor subunit TctC
VMKPDEFGRFIEAEIERWAKLIRANGIQIN